MRVKSVSTLTESVIHIEISRSVCLRLLIHHKCLCNMRIKLLFNWATFSSLLSSNKNMYYKKKGAGPGDEISVHNMYSTVDLNRMN